ncbi:MAG: GspE family protein [Candidatus Peribacteria bacterium]|nr:GspE family protein [Candidatus Peribacteria bacterium]
MKNFNPLAYNISTLEDPVEYNIDYVNQSQVKPEI